MMDKISNHKRGAEMLLKQTRNRMQERFRDILIHLMAAGFTSQVQLLGFRGKPRRAFDIRGIFLVSH